MKTLFLHIGTRKTATTSIQDFCTKNRTVLESKGYCYPDSVYTFPNVKRNRNAHFMVNMVKEADGRNYAEEEQIFSLSMEDVHRCFQEYENIVMSDENIWHHSVRYHKKLWKNLKADAQEYGYTIKIIVYLRRQDEFLSSHWNQLIKMGVTARTWEDYFEKAPVRLKYMLDYAANVKRIAKVFGKENIIIRRFSRDSFYNGTIYADFLHCIGLELTDEYEELEEEKNFGLKGNMVEIMRVMNSLLLLEKDDNRYWRDLLLKSSELSDKDNKCSMFSKEEAEEFINRYREGNEQIAADFIGDGKPLFDYEVEDIPKWKKDNEYMLDDVIRVFTVIAYESHQSVLALEQQVEILKREKEEMKKQIKENRLSVDNITRKGKHYILRKLGMKNE